MNFRQLFTDDRAVSPVIGVILMVAITVILAAVIGTFVLGLGDQVQSTTPQAQFGFDSDIASGQNDTVTVTHESGDTIEASNLNASVSGATENGSTSVSYTATLFTTSGTVSAGDSDTLEYADFSMSQNPGSELSLDGSTVRVIWTNPDSDKSSTLAKREF